MTNFPKLENLFGFFAQNLWNGFLIVVQLEINLFRRISIGRNFYETSEKWRIKTINSAKILMKQASVVNIGDSLKGTERNLEDII